jgi:threonine 3-dehydrogenase
MNVLITGGTGFLGSQLARTLLERGQDVVLFDLLPNLERLKDIADKIRVVSGNLAVWPEVLNVVKENDIEGIYHLGSMLAQTSQANPWASFQTNVCGTMHVLEAARIFNVKKVVFIGSLSIYIDGSKVPRVITDNTFMNPASMYSSGKLYCEHLGRFYRTKFDLDFRSLRPHTLVGPGIRTPGAAQYLFNMPEHGALGKPYECNVAEDSRHAGLIYFKDAVRALELIYQAPMEQIKTVNYNISGIKGTISAGELEQAVKKYAGDFLVTYKPDKENIASLEKYKEGMQVIDDTKAKEEWGWEPLYQNFDVMVSDFVNEVRTRPEFYGVKM